MFEQQTWADVDPTSGEPMWLQDEPELTDEEYLAEVERMIAADPLNRPDPCPAEIIARGESEAMTPGLIAQLHAIDPSTLDEDLRIGFSVAWDRAANYCHAQRGLAVASIVTASPDGVEI